MATVKFVLRYNTEQQKKKLEKIAKKCGRSANSHILHLIDNEVNLRAMLEKYQQTGIIEGNSDLANIAPLLKSKPSPSKP